MDKPTAPPAYSEVANTMMAAQFSYGAGSPQHQQQPQVVVIQQQVPVFGILPIRTTCTYCQNNVITRIEKVITGRTHLAFLICLLLCPCLCGCAPCIYCGDSCKAHHHYCPKCNNLIGIGDIP